MTSPPRARISVLTTMALLASAVSAGAATAAPPGGSGAAAAPPAPPAARAAAGPAVPAAPPRPVAKNPTDSGLPPVDRRLTGKSAAVTTAQSRELAELGQVEVGWSELGTPRSLRARSGALTAPSSAAPDAVARKFLADHPALFKQSAAEPSEFVLTMQDHDRSGATFLRYRQTQHDLAVHDSSLLVVLDQQRRIIQIGGTVAPATTPAAAPRLTANAAVARAVADVSPRKDRAAPRRLATTRGTTTFANTYAVPDLRNARPVRAELVALPSAGVGRTAWRELTEVASNAEYESLVDAATGAILYRENQWSSDEPHGLVHTGDDPEAGGQVPDVPFSGLDGSWVAGETTQGNNTDTYQDLWDDDVKDAADQPDTEPAPNQHFDYPWTDTWGSAGVLPVSGTSRDAVVTQLFYYTNWYHDYAYNLGFTETARNFQADNFGRGGTGGDGVLAEADDGYGDGTSKLCTDSANDPVPCRNNANFNANGPDGVVPRMQMYVGEDGSRRTQRAMNRDTVVHEYTHGITGRIISDGNLDGGVQSGALGEGWSDAFATSINDDPVYGEYNNGNYTTGIRGVAYDDDSLEYGDLCNGSCEVHDDGRIWAMAMWEQRAALIAKLGAAAGKAKHEELLMLGVKSTVDTPSFHDARTGYLQADQLSPGPDNQCLIWRIFADNELGVTAAPDADDDTTPTISTATPAACAPAAAIAPPPTVPEGTPVALSGGASTVGGDPGDTLVYAWDLDNDGQYDDSTSATPSWTFGDNGSFTVRLRVTNTAGYTATASRTVLVTNVAPAVTIDPGQLTTALEGGALSVTATFTDPGWLDTFGGTLTTGTPYLPPFPVPVGVTSAEPPAATGKVQASITYGDNGAYTLGVSVRDDDAGAGSDSVQVTIANVAPTPVIDESGAVLINGVPTIFADAGQPVVMSSTVTDPGSDDLTTQWTWGDGTLSPSVTNLVNPPGVDPPNSPTVQPRSVKGDATHAWADACAYDVSVTTADDDGATASDATKVLITATPRKSQGNAYWLHQFAGILLPKDFTHAQLDCYLKTTGYLSKVFNELRDASTRSKAGDVLSPGLLTSTPKKRLDAQLLTGWLNFANGGVEYNEPVVDSNNDGQADLGFATVIATAEAVRANPAATGAQLDRQARILSCVNERDYLLPPLICSLLR